MRQLKLSDKYKIYFLSNLSDTSYEYLRNILDEFDGGAYSFQEGIMKPDEKFYQVLLSRYNLNPQESIFFDDRESNIAAAEKLGIMGVLVRSTDDLLTAGLLWPLPSQFVAQCNKIFDFVISTRTIERNSKPMAFVHMISWQNSGFVEQIFK